MKMSVMVKDDPNMNTTAIELSLGTWFMDFHDELYVVVDAGNGGKKRVVCLSRKHHAAPFIMNTCPSNVLVARILPAGTTLKIEA